MSYLDADRWVELRACFDSLIELNAIERAARLAEIGRSDPGARRTLDELLAADAAANERLARVESVFGVAEPASTPDPIGALDTLGLTGKTVAHFRIMEPLASGGMGVVYRAEDTHLGRAAALKFPLDGRRVDPRLRERFLGEARAAAAVDHPNLCSIYEAGETGDGRLFIAMALYDGETLRTRLVRDGRLPIADALAIAAQIAHGLSAAHGAGIVHRDLKPANVMLLPDGGVKLLDFGLAKVTDISLTASRATIGTVSYMAPEQVRGEPLDARTDLWALGVLLYEMLTGRRPFTGEHEIAIMHAIVNTVPVRAATLRPELSPGVDRIVHTLLSAEPSGRYPSAVAVAVELTRTRQRDAASQLSRAGAFLPRLAALLPRFAVAAPRRRRVLGAAGVFALGAAAVLALGVSVVGFSTWLLGRGDAGSASAPRIVAVLPLANVDSVEGSEYLAVGLGDAISSQLARLRTVAVPGEHSMREYRASSRPLPQAAHELEATRVVHGSVQRVGDGVLLDIRLFDAATGRDSWTRSYRRPVTELLSLQRDVTRDIAAALRLDLTDTERALLARMPATHSGAYDLYLRGRDVQLRETAPVAGAAAVERLQRAQSFFARARELDPDFALARARLAATQLDLAWRDNGAQARRDQARVEADAALRLVPGLPEAHDALAFYWTLEGETLKAVDELQLALAGFPNVGDLHYRLGINLRTLGHWEEGIRELDLAIRFDPRHRPAHFQTALTYGRVRRYQESVRIWERLIAMSPDDPMPRLIRGFNYMRQGTVDTLEAELTRIPATLDNGGMTTFARYHVHRIRGRHREALAVLDSARHGISRDGYIYRPVSLMRAQTLQLMGEHAAARVSYEKARTLLEDSVAAHPQDASIRIALGLAYAGLGRKTEAAREARKAMELVPVSANNPDATAFMGGAVEVFVEIGDADAAFELLDVLLASPAGREVSVPLLRLDGIFDPIRSDPRFQQLIDRYSRD